MALLRATSLGQTRSPEHEKVHFPDTPDEFDFGPWERMYREDARLMLQLWIDAVRRTPSRECVTSTAHLKHW